MSQMPPPPPPPHATQYVSPDPWAAGPSPRHTSVMAVVALILGVLAFCFFGFGVIGLILGIIALVRIGKSMELGGKGLAVAGVITSAVGGLINVLLCGGMIALLYPAMGVGIQAAQMDMLSQAMQQYAADNQGYLPPSPDVLRGQYITADEVANPITGKSLLPQEQPTPLGEGAFRYADVIWLYDPSVTVDQFPAYGILAVSVSSEQKGFVPPIVAVMFVNGSTEAIPLEGLERLLQDEVDRRAQQGYAPVFDVDAVMQEVRTGAQGP